MCICLQSYQGLAQQAHFRLECQGTLSHLTSITIIYKLKQNIKVDIHYSSLKHELHK
jgi:hypothetical protein